MTDFDLLISGGTIVTASDTYTADIGVQDGRIAAIASNLECSNRHIDATGKFVLPGGVEGHCHIEQESGMGIMAADDYKSGSISAVFRLPRSIAAKVSAKWYKFIMKGQNRRP